LRAVFTPILLALRTVFPAILLAIFLPIRTAIFLPVGAAVLLAHVPGALGNARRGGSEGKGCDGGRNDAFFPHEGISFHWGWN
jgi:hypothetical protein